MVGEVEFTDQFKDWWNTLSVSEQESVAATVGLLKERGTSLGFPNSSGINGSKHEHMRELRTQAGGHPLLRTLYAFDPTRTAILLIGGDKTGKDRWYAEFGPRADKLCDDHLQQMRKEGRTSG